MRNRPRLGWRVSHRDSLAGALLAMTSAAVFATAARADVIDTRGMAPHEQCAYCHGLDGNSQMARFPRLAGQNPAYLRKQLADFRQGRRTNDEGAMSGIADTLTEAEIEAIVGHYSAQASRAHSTQSASEIAAGKRLYFEGRAGIAACATCHGAKAPALEGAPSLAGQHGAYIEKQLHDFRRGARRNDSGGVMRRIAQALAESEMRALAAFVSSQPVITGASR